LKNIEEVEFANVMMKYDIIISQTMLAEIKKFCKSSLELSSIGPGIGNTLNGLFKRIYFK